MINQITYTRTAIEELRNKIEKEKDKYSVIPPGPRFGTFLQWPPFNEYARDACEIFVAGGSLDNLTQLFGFFLVEYYRQAICRALRRLAKIDRDQKLEIRLNPAIPALAVMILNGSRPDGRIRVDIQPFQATVLERPVFELTRQGQDRVWYDMFYRQYAKKLWSMAKPVDLSDLASIWL